MSSPASIKRHLRSTRCWLLFRLDFGCSHWSAMVFGLLAVGYRGALSLCIRSPVE